MGESEISCLCNSLPTNNSQTSLKRRSCRLLILTHTHRQPPTPIYLPVKRPRTPRPPVVASVLPQPVGDMCDVRIHYISPSAQCAFSDTPVLPKPPLPRCVSSSDLQPRVRRSWRIRTAQLTERIKARSGFQAFALMTSYASLFLVCRSTDELFGWIFVWGLFFLVVFFFVAFPWFFLGRTPVS